MFSVQIIYFKELWGSSEVNAEGNCNAPAEGGLSWWDWNSTNEIVQISQIVVNVCGFGGKLWHFQGNGIFVMCIWVVVQK